MDKHNTRLFLVRRTQEQKMLYLLVSALFAVLAMMLWMVSMWLGVGMLVVVLFFLSFACCQIEVFDEFVVVRKLLWFTKTYLSKDMKLYVLSHDSLMRLDDSNELYSCCVYDTNTRPMFRFALGKGAMENSDRLYGYLQKHHVYERRFDA